ncbi:hypothetical protein V1478_007087 [Vespula squamosa]|uniref:Uncharacterized protein n=1 Tax=Vespula squamosa TaxID=30214 RepID=A0ABD2B271_VESSQ
MAAIDVKRDFQWSQLLSTRCSFTILKIACDRHFSHCEEEEKKQQCTLIFPPSADKRYCSANSRLSAFLQRPYFMLFSMLLDISFDIEKFQKKIQK